MSKKSRKRAAKQSAFARRATPTPPPNIPPVLVIPPTKTVRLTREDVVYLRGLLAGQKDVPLAVSLLDLMDRTVLEFDSEDRHLQELVRTARSNGFWYESPTAKIEGRRTKSNAVSEGKSGPGKGKKAKEKEEWLAQALPPSEVRKLLLERRAVNGDVPDTGRGGTPDISSEDGPERLDPPTP